MREHAATDPPQGPLEVVVAGAGVAEPVASPGIPGPAPSPPAILAADLCVRRGDAEVLSGVGFTIAAGRVTGLFGPSGSGKTTLMRALVGVQRGVSGRLDVLGVTAGSPSLRRRVAYVTQATSVYTDLSVQENLRYFAALMGAGRDSIAAALDAVSLTSMADRPVRTLSGGQQIRVSLATALLGDPSVLILDEPTVGLDPLLRRDLWSLFAQLATAGRTLLVSSHVMDEARHCDTLLLLRGGRLIWRDSPAALAAATGTDDLDTAFARIVERGLESGEIQ
jgi:ABC-2 type transport system ATP-binding protein